MADTAIDKPAKKGPVSVEIVQPEGGKAAVLSLFHPVSVGNALVKSGWTAEREMEIMTTIAGDEDENTWARIAAIKHITARGRDALILSGAIQTMTSEGTAEDDQGRRVTMRNQTMRLLEGDLADVHEMLALPEPLPMENEDERTDDGAEGYLDLGVESEDSPDLGEFDTLAEKLAAGQEAGETTFREGHTPPTRRAGLGVACPREVNLATATAHSQDQRNRHHYREVRAVGEGSEVPPVDAAVQDAVVECGHRDVGTDVAGAASGPGEEGDGDAHGPGVADGADQAHA